MTKQGFLSKAVLSTLLIAAASFGATFGSVSKAEASASLTMSYGDYEVNGSTTLDLRSALQSSYPSVSIGRRIIGVSVRAKSEYGNGSTYLWVGSNTSAAATIGGRYDRFYDSDSRTFSSVYVSSPDSSCDQDWKLVLNGHIILRDVTVYFDDPAPVPRPPRSQTEFLRCNGGQSPCYSSGPILRARLHREFSYNECVLDYNWGVKDYYIWTSGRCDASFEIELR